MQTVLIADSGSTKTDWCILRTGQEPERVTTSGFNPYFHDQQYINTTIRKELKRSFLDTQPSHIYFYGAGCGTSTKQGIVKEALKELFSNADIQVDHDLLAAARALCGKEAGIAAILGTGSNSCYYDGKDITEHVASLGFILGDEGSGAYMGKLLSQLYLYEKLDKNLVQQLEIQFGLSPEILLDSIYKKENPNRYLASFFEFIYAQRTHPQIAELIRIALHQFFITHIQRYTLYKSSPFNAVGSVAFLLQEEVRTTAKSLGIACGKIIKSPMEGLIDYHR